MVMLSQAEIASKYINLYKALRNYIWGFETVEKIAELEVACYNTFPNMEDVRRKFNTLYSDIRETCKEDRDLEKAVAAFREKIEASDTIFARLKSVV